MAKRKRNIKKDYEVGYCKPPKKYQWKKGCKSPNPKGRPKKPKTLKEALQLCFNKEISAKNEKGEIQKISCIEALASKTLADAISKDGPTRRLLYRSDILNLETKEPEIEYPANSKEVANIEKEYGELLRAWTKIPPKERELSRKLIVEQLRQVAIKRLQKDS